jgi:type VI secretion system ImpM family protein
VLGSIIMKPSWKWAAIGKHPLAMDYFQFGRNEALADTFANWIDNGYQKVVSMDNKKETFHSWRFWIPGKRKGSIACGIGRNSSDRLGRPYPLTIIGMGTIQGWEDHWDLLPAVFEETWSRMEYLASAQLKDLKELEREINQIKKPSMKEVPGIVQPLDEDRTSLLDEIKAGTRDLMRENEIYVHIKDNSNHDAFSLVMQWHRGLKLHLRTWPGIVLMGGTPERSYLAAFNRSLNANDFVKLWTI